MQNERFVTPLGNDGMYVLDTAAWRTEHPVIDKDKCIDCGLCMGFCPVNSIYCEDRSILISYDYCKGCGICAAECPRKAIDMVQGGK